MPDNDIDIPKRNRHWNEKSMLYLKLIALVKTEHSVMYTFPFNLKAIIIKVVPTDHRAVNSR